MKPILCLLFACLSATVFGQMEQRSALTMGGSSTTITQNSTTYYISESVGQQGAIGTFYNEALTARQGFQQPPVRVNAIAQSENPLDAVVFPNPVTTSVTVQFNEIIQGAAIASVYDVQGKLVLQRQWSGQSAYQMDLSFIAAGTYVLKVSDGNREFISQLIKN